MRTRLLFGGLLVAAAMGLAVLSLLSLQPRYLLLRHFRTQLRSVQDGDPAVPKYLQQIASLDQDGLPLLWETLRDPRPSVAASARAAVNDLLDRWQLLPARSSSPRVASLASLMAADCQHVPPTLQTFYADLTTRLLLWPVDRESANVSQLVADCDFVLRSLAKQRDRWLSPPDGDRRDATLANDPAGPQPTRSDSELAAATPMIDAPGPRPPIEMDTVPSLLRAAAGDSAPASSPAAARSATPLSRGTFESQPPLHAPETAFPQEIAPIAIEPTPAWSTDEPTPSPHDRLSEFEWIRQFAVGDAEASAAARDELKRRGFQPVHFELAARACDSDPAVRRALATALPQIPGVNLRPWFLLLAGDEDPSVRKTVFGVMATTRDPAIRDCLRRAELNEDNPEVLRFVRSVLHERRIE